ncbi:Cupin domain-containing protein [Halopelagius inordinatus]|uniref:Cupin domain-containing protein n=1 Tax=Halopelagius inordinatus TaxID=553467 RepID=A0A1I2UQV5_9EURY|nr:cupin domain-containing protein [Halopelagius inordinatus]SFG78087.1 Cupin domain-containing protein [Halopelagius inordinatus]
MSHTTVAYEDVDPVGGGLHFLRDELDCENLGFSVLEADPGWVGKEHDHAEDGQEEVYFLVDGEATLTVDGDEVRMKAGEAVRIPPEATRQLENGSVESTFVLAGAP